MRQTQNSYFSFFQKTQRVPTFTISKSLSFLSLRYVADLRRSRLVDKTDHRSEQTFLRSSRLVSKSLRLFDDPII